MKKKNNPESSISRRQFVKSAGGVAIFIGVSGLLPQMVSCSNPDAIKAILEKHDITNWVRLSEDGTLTIYNPAAEMGQGSMTSLPVIFAEEMDAEWDKVSVEFSPQVADIYGSEGWGSRRIQLSAGSRVTKGYYSLLRRAGAQARHILLESVAQEWLVPVEQLTTRPGVVMDTASQREIKYGDIVPILKIPDELPEFSLTDLKSPGEFNLIGRDQYRTDIPDKINGKAQFAIDVRLPGMLYGMIERGRIHGAAPTLKNQDSIEDLDGITKVVKIDYGIGIIGETVEQVMEARKNLQIEWGEAEASGFNSQEAFSEYEKIAQTPESGRIITNEGNVSRAWRQAYKTYSADFKNDYVYHAQMEPLNAVVKVAEDRASAEVWIGTQQGFAPKAGIPEALGIEADQVVIHMQYLGGGFGRRSMNDFGIECAILAREVAPSPVKLIWTREDDLTYGAYRPMSLQRLKASVNKEGALTGLSHVVIGDGDNLLASGIRNQFYNIPNQHAEIRLVPQGIRLKHWRSVGHGPNKFAIECLVDEIAHDQKMDPVAYRRKLMNDSPRALATLEKAAEMANWDVPASEGRAKGVAFVERSGTLSTGICEISLDRSTGKIRVHHFWSANDAGIVIQPDNVRAQLEGGIIMGMSSTFFERLTIEDGQIVQSNFHDYSLLRMEDAPESIETAIIPSNLPPQGVGESGTPLVACAIANAFHTLTGKSLRHLPFTPERVLQALDS